MEPGLLLAYIALGVGAVVPIYIGSTTSVKSLSKKSKKSTSDDSSSEDEEDETERLSSEDAMWFPVMGSGVLFGLYLVFKYISKEYIHYLLTAYFAVLGAAAVTKALSSMLHASYDFKSTGWNRLFTLRLKENCKGKKKQRLWSMKFDFVSIAASVLALALTVYYVLTKNWIASNVFGEAFSISAIQLLQLDDFRTGILLLSGLFFYDIFWVFGTDVMVTVAKQFDAPVKILFPKNLFGSEKLQFTMLGLGDIVIPGIFVAMCLRYDHRSGRVGRPYFKACLLAYTLGLVMTVWVMHTFQAAQPALLYLSPACILSVLILALVRGEWSELFAYTAVPDAKVMEKKTSRSPSPSKRRAKKAE